MAQLYLDTCQSSRLVLCDTHPQCIAARLAVIGVRYARHALPSVTFDPAAERDEVIADHLPILDPLVAASPCASIEVLDVGPDHAHLDALDRRFMTEHWHTVAESQLLVWGRGVLFMRVAAQVFALRCEAGDFVQLPPQLCHWFEMDRETGFRTIRLFAGRRHRHVSRTGRDMRGVYAPVVGASGAAAG